MAPPIKIVSDFDGVWTNPEPEAEVLQAYIIAACADLLGDEPGTVAEQLDSFIERVLGEAHTWGWAPDGRISAFADEDPLCVRAGLLGFLAHSKQPDAVRYRKAIIATWGAVARFGEHCFVTAMTRFRHDHPPSMVPQARAQLEAVLAAGAEVVVVSNSEPDKLEHWFTAAGIDASPRPGHQVRLRGAAGKQVLGRSDDHLMIDGRRVHIDRPLYLQALLEEQPDLVIGDIFSLDLALPHAMREQGHRYAPRRLVLLQHPHTPDWVMASRGGGAIDHVVEQFGDLAALLDPHDPTRS